MIFFRNLSGKLLRDWWFFSGDLSKGNLWLQRSFRGKDKIWDKFRQFRQKFLARVSIMLSSCPREASEEEKTSTIFYPLTFFTKFSSGRVAKHAIYVTGDVFSWNAFFEKSSCLYFYFQTLSGRFLDFCRFFWQGSQNCTPREQRNVPRKTYWPRRNTNSDFGFSAKKVDSEKQFGMFLKNASYVSGGKFGASFWICN